MAGRTKSNKYVGHITRQIVAKNLRNALHAKYGEKKNHARRFEEEHLVNFSTTQRILEEDIGVTVDTLELIAGKLGISVYELLIPPKEVQRMLRVQELAPMPVTANHEPMIRSTDEAKEPISPTAKPRRISR